MRHLVLRSCSGNSSGKIQWNDNRFVDLYSEDALQWAIGGQTDNIRFPHATGNSAYAGTIMGTIERSLEVSCMISQWESGERMMTSRSKLQYETND